MSDWTTRDRRPGKGFVIASPSDSCTKCRHETDAESTDLAHGDVRANYTCPKCGYRWFFMWDQDECR